MYPRLLDDSRTLFDTHWSRRRLGVVTLVLVSLAALIRLRGTCESILSISLELFVQGLIVSLWFVVQGSDKQASKKTTELNCRVGQAAVTLGTAAMLAPWVLQALLRVFGLGTSPELVAMSSFAWGVLVASICARRQRSLGTIVVCSGFLTLVATCSSDHISALCVALLWGIICLWWLASAHWERTQRCQVNLVVENHWQQPVVVAIGCLVFAIAAWSVTGRFVPLQERLWEISPTSGGTSWNDEFARSGVGDGDKLISAREQATTFGAVDSQLLLDSKEASLFDLYSDTFGEPVRKKKIERTIALTSQQMDELQSNTMAASDASSSSLTTQRRAATKHVDPSKNISDALLFWIGRPNSHLALERFSLFDGISWQASALPEADSSGVSHRGVSPCTMGDKTWFSCQVEPLVAQQQAAIFRGSHTEAIKIARLKSPRLPTVAGMHSWHIHQVDDGSLFGVDENDNLWMHGRDCVPEFTVVRYINREIDLESLVQAISPSHDCTPSADSITKGQMLAHDWAQQFRLTGARNEPWTEITTLIDHLRTQYQLDYSRDSSNSQDPLADFFESRKGSDLMFATAAAIALRALGYQTRLVTGLIARRENLLGWTKEYAVYPQNTHAWLELQAASGNWIPLEPSPGFPLPDYRISWHYWWHLHRVHLLSLSLAAIALTSLFYWQRAWLFDGLCRLSSWAWWLGNDRQRCRWLLAILDWRLGLIGCHRPPHASPRLWIGSRLNTQNSTLPLIVTRSTQVFFAEADRLWFGNHATLSSAGREAGRTLWSEMNCRILRNAIRSSAQHQTTSRGLSPNHDD